MAEPAALERIPSSVHPAIGGHLREARAARGLTLRDLADRLGLSPSLISQIETGRASPSVRTLYAIASELQISVDDLLFPSTDGPFSATSAAPGSSNPARRMPARPVQRATDREVIRLASGVTWERLTSESLPGIDFLYVTYEVGGASSAPDEFQRHQGREWGYVLSGRLGVAIGFETHVLEPGDAISIDSSVPHRLYTVGDVPAHAVWFVLGRQASPE